MDDGTIPAQVNKFQVLAQNRRRMIKASFGQHPLDSIHVSLTMSLVRWAIVASLFWIRTHWHER